VVFAGAAHPTAAFAVEPALAPTGTLRAIYIESNLAQMSRDPATGVFKGVSADIARELARRANVPLVIAPAASAAVVLDAVRGGTADIGFVAPNPDRTGLVLYSQTYMLVQQSALVRVGAGIGSVEELDRPGRTIGVNTGDSVGVWLRGRLQHARLRESPDSSLKEAAAWLLDGTVDAFAGNRQRLAVGTRHLPDLRLLPDNLYGVPQTVAVALERPEVLASINVALDEMRNSGFLARSVADSGVDGISVAPAPK
jgi:polar amino acid transport system substrate-binding protein